MNTSNRFKSLSAGLLAFASVLGFALLPTAAHAQTPAPILVTATDALPSMNSTGTGFYLDGADQQYANTSVNLGLFDFSSDLTAVDALTSLVGVQIAIELNSLETSAKYDGLGVVDLTLDGIDTGIALNNYPKGNGGANLPPGPVVGIADALDAATILQLFQDGGYSYSIPVNNNGYVENSGVPTNDYTYTQFNNPVDTTTTSTTAGQLVVGVTLVGGNTPTPSQLAAQDNYASDGDPAEFYLEGGTASLEIANFAIPFEPSQALGLGLISLCMALWFIPQTKQMMKRLLVPARA